MDSDDRRLAEEISALRNTLRALRGPDGCPWDRDQTIDNIITYMIEEAYELLQAERSGDWDEVAGELGDVLFLVVFVHELLLEQERVSLADITKRVHEKIISRHPHVFGDSSAADKQESIAQWERMKQSERDGGAPEGILADIPDHLPPLRKATAIQRKVASVGFDWPDTSGIIEKIREEIAELEEEMQADDRNRIKEEIGDLLFTIVNLARRMNISPESALETCSVKFMRRFNELEDSIIGAGGTLEAATLDEMERLWQRSKGGD
jgi:MazG family protein